MNCLDDQTLMAYADGELDAAGRLQVEQALAADANLAARVRAHQALRRRVAAAYDPELQDTVPERLLRAAAPPTAPLLDLAGARAARAASRAPGSRHALAGWARWGGLAACLVLGLALGTRLQQSGTEESVYASAGAGLVARGALARALDGQAAGAAGPSAVAVSLSFVDRGGRYCRAYTQQGSGR